MLLGVVLALLQGPMVGPPMPEGPGILPPGVVSAGPIQGPMVTRPAKRGKGFYCDMTSDTCSDGRKISTAVTGDRPCEKVKGVWSYVGPNEACFNWRGELEVWGTTTTYVSWGAELDKRPWTLRSGASLTRTDDGYLITYSSSNSDLVSSTSGAGLGTLQNENWTSSCIVKQGPSLLSTIILRNFHGSHGINTRCEGLPVGADWGTVSCTSNTEETTPVASLFIYPGRASDVEAKACWQVKSNSPGRPCWADDEAPITCDGENNSISIAGWPTNAGSVCISFRLTGGTHNNVRLFDSRPGNQRGFLAYLSGSRTLNIQAGGESAAFVATDDWNYTAEQTVCISRDANGMVGATKNGVPMGGARVMAPWEYGTRANLGADSAFRNTLNGSISHLSVRSYDQ